MNDRHVEYPGRCRLDERDGEGSQTEGCELGSFGQGGAAADHAVQPPPVMAGLDPIGIRIRGRP